MKKSFIFLTEFNEWVGTLMDATDEEFKQYLSDLMKRLLEDGSPDQTQIVIYEINPPSISIKLVKNGE